VPEDPVTLWISQLRDDDEAAATNLWNHFVDRIRGVARKKLNFDSRRVYDDEDVAQSAFHSICAGVASGRFPDLRDRNCLWQLIMVVTSRKISFRHRYDRRDCRDIQRNSSDFFLNDSNSVVMLPISGQALSREPTAEFTAEFLETYENLIETLNDPALEQVVALRMEGYTDKEIASRLECSRRTVQRRLEIVRRQLERMEFPHE
jgi:RNA polymerase sigma factor (sigma-70 family)